MVPANELSDDDLWLDELRIERFDSWIHKNSEELIGFSPLQCMPLDARKPESIE